MEIILKLKNTDCLHARPAGILAKKAAEFQSTLQISYKGQVKSAKSIMALMSLGIAQNEDFKLIATGADEAQAAQAIQKLIDNDFQ